MLVKDLKKIIENMDENKELCIKIDCYCADEVVEVEDDENGILIKMM